jgi:hypothetical protein
MLHPHVMHRLAAKANPATHATLSAACPARQPDPGPARPGPPAVPLPPASTRRKAGRSWSHCHYCRPAAAYTKPMLEKLQSHPGFQGLPREDQLHVLLHPHRKDKRTALLVKKVFSNWHEAMFHFVSLALGSGWGSWDRGW